MRSRFRTTVIVVGLIILAALLFDSALEERRERVELRARIAQARAEDPRTKEERAADRRAEIEESNARQRARYESRVRERTAQKPHRTPPRRRADVSSGVDEPCSITADDIRGWSQARITAAFQECAAQTGYTEDTEDTVDHDEAMITCRTRLRDAARVLAGTGHLFRWTDTGLETMFSDRRDAGGDVATYIGDALEVEDDDGSWIPASYECDYDHAAGQIVDVRTAEGRLR